MKTLVFSDVHGNALALEAMLDHVRDEDFDSIACLGNAIQSGPQPAETVSRLRELACSIVMGSADDWLLTGEDSGAEQIASERMVKMNAVRDWSLAQFYFHVGMAYAILRKEGVPLGKIDYLSYGLRYLRKAPAAV